MNKFIVLLIILVVCLGFWMLSTKRGKLEYISVINAPLQVSSSGTAGVASLNKKNSQINNITYNNIELRIVEKASVRVQGYLAYEKDKKFRMVMRSFMGKESDIGSNEMYFWFWSKRMQPPALYYAAQENISKTKLKTPLHPLWIMETLGIGEVSLSDAVVAQRSRYWSVSQRRISMSGSQVTKITLIDPEKLAIVGHYLYEAGRLTVATEIIDFYQIGLYWLPKKVHTMWVDENVDIYWSLDQPKVNTRINPDLWNAPNIKNKIDMAK